MKRVLNSLILGLLTSVYTLPGISQVQEERWYEVEIILFENLDPEALYSEKWPQDPGNIEMDDVIKLSQSAEFKQPWLIAPAIEESSAIDKALPAPELTPEGLLKRRVLTEPPVAYQILSEEKHQLNAAYQRIQDSSAYQPLLHIAWQQAVPPRQTPDRILLHEGMDAPQTQPLPPLLMAMDTQESRGRGEAEYEERLRGLFKLSIARYLHVETDLMFHKPEMSETPAILSDMIPQSDWPLPDTKQDPLAPYPLSPLLEVSEPEPEFFRIQAELRTRSREIHYLDHPLVGMLILFTPVELPVLIEEEEATPEPALAIEPPLIDDPRVIQDDSF